jgi:glycosyltransferase involved in cell wall biosynthesis
MKVLGLIASPTDPSSRFRILQYFPYLKEKGIEPENWYSVPTKDSSPAEWTKELQKLTSINPWRTWDVVQNIARLPILINQFSYDIIWQSRLLLPYLFSGEKAISKPLVLDIDDAIWLLPGEEKRVERAVAEATEIFAGNDYLAQWCSKWNKKVSLIPTTVDTSLFFPKEKIDDRFTIGWIGTPSNFHYLELVRKPIQDFLFKYYNTRFVVVSNTKPELFAFDDKQVVFKEWRQDSENDLINGFDIGIMPLKDDDWAKGKCGFKLLQYMACQKPTIASPIGTNIKLLRGNGLSANTSEEWFSAFEQLYRDKEAATTFGKNGRAFVEQQYSTSNWSSSIVEKFNALKK